MAKDRLFPDRIYESEPNTASTWIIGVGSFAYSLWQPLMMLFFQSNKVNDTAIFPFVSWIIAVINFITYFPLFITWFSTCHECSQPSLRRWREWVDELQKMFSWFVSGATGAWYVFLIVWSVVKMNDKSPVVEIIGLTGLLGAQATFWLFGSSAVENMDYWIYISEKYVGY